MFLYLAFLPKVRNSGSLERTMKCSRNQLKWSPSCWYHHCTASLFIHSAHAVCSKICCLELEYFMAEFQTESKFDILFLKYTCSAWVSWQPCGSFILNTISLCLTWKFQLHLWRIYHAMNGGKTKHVTFQSLILDLTK